MRLYLPEDGSRRLPEALRWSAAAALVAGLHLAAGWWFASHAFVSSPPPDAAKGIPIDLEPVAVPQNAPEPASVPPAGPAPAPQAAAAPEAAPAPETPAADPPPDAPPDAPQPPDPAQLEQVTQAAPQPEPTPPQPAPPDDVQPPPQITPLPEPPQVSPPPPKEVKSDAMLAPPPPRPKQPPKPDPRVLAREAAVRKARAAKREQERAARQEARVAARAQAQARAAVGRESGGQAATAAVTSSASSGADAANWRGAVVAHLNGFKPASSGAAGTARVAFAVDRGGRVVSASLAASSGDPQLDAAAVAMVRRASPLPAPPPDLGGRINLTVPVRFH